MVHLRIMGIPGGATSTSPLQVCLNGLKEAADLGTRLLWWSMPKKSNAKHTFMASTMPETVEEHAQLMKKWGQYEEELMWVGGVCMLMFATLSKHMAGRSCPVPTHPVPTVCERIILHICNFGHFVMT